MPRIVSLAEAGSPQAFGGKAAGLARLIAAGASVPEGFALEATDRPLAEWPAVELDALRVRIEELLGRGPIAVRSSAVGEDSETRSYAGLLETCLGPPHVDGALAAAERCLRSGGSERVRAYAAQGAAIPVGLVVQRLVAARAAGVVFTLDPQGRDRALVIEAVAGTGDALVSGRVAPERWRVYRTGLGTLEALPDRDTAGGVLSRAAALAVALEALRLAEHFARPLDLEWAWEDAGLRWLQARPITALREPTDWVIERFEPSVEDGPVSVWSNWNVRETLPQPLTPLNASLWRELILPGVLDDLLGVRRNSRLARSLTPVDLVHGRLYWNMNGLLAGPFGLFLERALRHLDARAAVVVARLRREGVLVPRRLAGGRGPFVHMLVRVTLRAAGRLGPGFRPSAALAGLREYAVALRSRPAVGTLDDDALVAEMPILFGSDSGALRRGLQMVVAAMVVWMAADRLYRPWPQARARLLAGLQGNPTTAISLGIDALVQAGRPLAGAIHAALGPGWRQQLEQAPGGAAWLARLDAFLSENGQRCPREFELAVPRWSEDPTLVLDLVRAGLLAPEGETLAARLARLGAERAVAIAEACRAAPPWKRPLLRVLARLVAENMPLREAPKHYSMVAFQRMRDVALEVGRRLVARGALDAPGDIFLLEWREATALLSAGRPLHAADDIRDTVTARRQRLARFDREQPPDFLRSDLVPVGDEGAPAAEDATRLRGTGCSRGTGQGPVRILREPDPAAMRRGDVLVVAFADPGWTPLFPGAAAVVMEVGGFLCHAAVVARELGIPAVFGVTDATRRLRSGEVVRVDGDGGEILRLNRPG